MLLVHTKVEVLDESLRGKLRLYALLAPHIARYGAGNSGWCSEIGATTLIHAQRERVHLVMACSTDFSRRSVGYVGASDGWQDLMGNFKMDWEFRRPRKGNIALTGEIDLPDSGEFTIADRVWRQLPEHGGQAAPIAGRAVSVAPGKICPPVATRGRESQFDFSDDTSDGGGFYRLSRCVLLAHEDKVFQGALVASMSIPWGETKGDNDLGGYHLVWTRGPGAERDRASRHRPDRHAARALIWLAALQRPDGSFPQNSWIQWHRLLVWPATRRNRRSHPAGMAFVQQDGATWVCSIPA